MKELIEFCVRRGIIFPDSEIYGNLAGIYTYGPVGVEIKKKLQERWWEEFVESRNDVVGIESPIILPKKVLEASGHLREFNDILVECTKCKEKFRADLLIEEKTGLKVEGKSKKEIEMLIKKYKIKCPKCGGELSAIKKFNLMFETHIGTLENENATVYLRPETAQGIFVNFKRVLKISRKKLPFGIAQIGKVFRNEISPRNFVFRCREFSQAELEFFVHPEKVNECELGALEKLEIKIAPENKRKSVKEIWEEKIVGTKWHLYWIAKSYEWLVKLGINSENLRIRKHNKDELAHYAKETWDIEYKFPNGWKEIEGVSNREDFDLKNHSEKSGEELSYFDEEKKEHVFPWVIEPSFGVDRMILALLAEAYSEKNGKKILKISPSIAPFLVAVFPLVNKGEMGERALEIFRKLKKEISALYDEKGSIGRRYARVDEIGVPFAVTVDGQTLEDDTVTIRDRDTTEQERVKENEIITYLKKFLTRE